MVNKYIEQITLRTNIIIPEIQCHSCQLEEIDTVPAHEGDNLDILNTQNLQIQPETAKRSN
jgi:hypothetical protein